MKIGKILTLSFLLLALVAIVNHQLDSKHVLNTSLISSAQAQGTPTSTPTPTPTSTPTPTPTPSPTPGIGQSCTPGFYKTHQQFIIGCGVTGPTETLTQLGLNNLATCNHNGTVFPMGDLSLITTLSAPASYCGPGTLAQQELNLLRQVITAYLNGANSNPQACGAAADIITLANAAIGKAAGGDSSALGTLQNSLETNINNDKFGSLCGGS